jgi:FAD/FMN-containing dehydrogenase
MFFLMFFFPQFCVFAGRSVPPDVVVFAENKDHVRAVAAYCDQKQLPLIPYGTGTGLEGGVNAVAVSRRSGN